MGLVLSNRIQIACDSCSQQLVVDAASAGKQVRCPKCQTISTVPRSKVAAPVEPPTPAATRVIGCPQCKTRMSVPVRERSFSAKCPGCQATIQVAPNKPVQSPTQVAQPQSRGNGLPPVSQPTPPSIAASGPNLDLGAMNLPSIASSVPTSRPQRSPATLPAHSSLAATVRNRTTKRGSSLVSWVNDHRWVTAIIALNLIALLCCIVFPPLLVIVLFSLPVAAVIVGLLFVPRQHTIKRFVGATGTQMLGAGGGGILLVLAISAKAVMRASRRAQDNPNVNLNSLSEVLPTILGIALFGVVFLVSWRYIGVARVMAAGYCVALGFSVLMGLIGGVSRGGPSWATRGSNAFPEGVNPPQFDGNEFMRRSRAEHDAFVARMEADRQRHQSEFEAHMNATRSVNAPPPYIPPPSNPSEYLERDPSLTQIAYKRYPITLPLPAGTRRVEADMQFTPGVKLSACYAGSWCKLTIVQVNDDGTLRMNWDDYRAFTYDMAREDMIVDSDTLESLNNS